MEADERSRHELFLALDESIGAGPAATLMAQLPPMNWTEVATKSDIGGLRVDIDRLRLDVNDHRAETRAALADHRAETRADLENFRTSFRAEITESLEHFRTSFRAETKSELETLEVATKSGLARLQTEIDTLGHNLRLEIRSSADRLRGDLINQMIAQTRTMIVALVTVVVAISGLALFTN
ncbi:MAG: hypothetical protein ACT4OS_01785 [Acidimicrobiales bacterium]